MVMEPLAESLWSCDNCENKNKRLLGNPCWWCKRGGSGREERHYESRASFEARANAAIDELKKRVRFLEHCTAAGARLYAGANKGFGMTAENAIDAMMALAKMRIEEEAEAARRTVQLDADSMGPA